jgi:hypothetical protein
LFLAGNPFIFEKKIMENILVTEEAPQTPKRSQFLTVLCVLSFIMCAIGFVSGVWKIYQSTPEAMQKNIEQFRAINPEMADQMENNMIEMQDNPVYKISPYLELVYTLISFLGVLMMWNFKRTGFYIYAIAEILPYTTILFMGKNYLKMLGPPGGSSANFAMIGLVLSILIDLVFVFLYSRNLKEMNK